MRNKIIEAILKRSELNPYMHKDTIEQSLKYLSDTNLLSLAADLGLDIGEIMFRDLKTHVQEYNMGVA